MVVHRDIRQVILFTLIMLLTSCWRDDRVAVAVDEGRGRQSEKNRIRRVKLGDTRLGAIPLESSRVVAMVKTSSRRVVGVTSGFESHFFEYDPDREAVSPLGVLPGWRATSLALADERELVYVAAERDGSDGVGVLSVALSNMIPQAVMDSVEYNILAPAELKSMDLKGYLSGLGLLVGLTAENEVVVYDVMARAVRRRIVVGEPVQTWGERRPLGSLLFLPAGLVGSGHRGRLYYLDLKTFSMNPLQASIPGLIGRERLRWLDSIVEVGSTVYGGTSEGYLFSLAFDPVRVQNYGKPLPEGRIWGLTSISPTEIFGIGGDEHGVSRMFSFDTEKKTFQEHGLVQTEGKDSWLGRQFRSLIPLDGGIIVAGDAELGGGLFLIDTKQLTGAEGGP